MGNGISSCMPSHIFRAVQSKYSLYHISNLGSNKSKKFANGGNKPLAIPIKGEFLYLVSPSKILFLH
jgi:hypothetical protein